MRCDTQVRDVLLDSLVDLCRDPSLLPSMYVNYDCDLEGSNLFERICKFLARSAFPYSGVLTSVHTQSIEGLQAVIAGTAHLAQRSSAAYCVFLPAGSDVHGTKGCAAATLAGCTLAGSANALGGRRSSRVSAQNRCSPLAVASVL
jgi:hypothetical protein